MRSHTPAVGSLARASAQGVVLVSFAVQSRGPVVGGLVADNGLALLAGHLLEAGCAPRILDFNTPAAVTHMARRGREDFLEACARRIVAALDETGADLLGFKLYANGFADSLRLAERVKAERPGTFIVGGGPQVNWHREAVFAAAPALDALIAGDGEEALLALARRRRGEDAPRPSNLALRGEPLRLSFPLRALAPARPCYDEAVYPDIGQKLLLGIVEGGRGCLNQACTFCAHPRRRILRRPVEQVLAEMTDLHERYGLTRFRLADSLPPAEFLHELAERLPEGFRFSAYGEFDEDLDPRRLGRGVTALFFGLETADPATLRDLYRKTADPERFLARAQGLLPRLRDAGVATVVSAIHPGPYDDERTFELTASFLEAAQPDFAPVLPLVVLPHTPLEAMVQADPERWGIALDPDFRARIMRLELDLLQPADRWPALPFVTRSYGRWRRDGTADTQRMQERLAAAGIHALSDDVIFMAEHHGGTLPAEQAERRAICRGFFERAWGALATGRGDELARLLRPAAQCLALSPV